MDYVAHSQTPEHPDGHLLIEHLEQVAKIAQSFFPEGFLQEAARLIGLYHDAGKIKDDVQRHILQNTPEKLDHSSMGAYLLLQKVPGLAQLLTASILGHHGGLANYVGDNEHGRTIEARLRENQPQAAINAFQALTRETDAPIKLPLLSLTSRVTLGTEAYMAVKMLHSALVDADFLDTEWYFDSQKATRRKRTVILQDLLPLYTKHMEELQANSAGTVNAQRAEILRQCLEAAGGEQGFYSLSVPTGGGKTLASLGFALHHAQQHPNIQRIIYAIPFTSIIEQNADVFRDVLGNDAVLEHHSAVGTSDYGYKTDLASENFDAPLIVTTNVQIFDSIFSNKPSKCRKLHNFQDSIIILDEMQALPDYVLRPCLAALDALVKDFRATVVICTATQPQYDKVWQEKPQIREIIRDVPALFDAMKRAYAEKLGLLEDVALVGELKKHNQVLCIVNSRAQAQRLALALGGEKDGVYHLSTMMCPWHRRLKLKIIRELLDRGKVCRVVSTSVVEAGVDLDFPVVYRAAAGLDSIVQAAGRCNRNGKSDPAPVYIFESPEPHIPPEIKRLADRTLKDVAPLHEDLLSPEAVAAYFKQRFGMHENLDKNGILPMIDENRVKKLFPYATIAESFSTIESGGEALFIPCNDEAKALIAQLETGPRGALLRSLQQYSVNIYPNQRMELLKRGFIRILDGILILDVPEEQLANVYTQEFGLQVGAAQAILMT